MGVININGLMVERNSCFYHMPNSVPIKYAFQGVKGLWFLHVEACTSVGCSGPGLSECIASEAKDHISNSRRAYNSMEDQESYPVGNDKANKRSRCRKKWGKRFHYLKPMVRMPMKPKLTFKNENMKRKKRIVSKGCIGFGADGLETQCLIAIEEKTGFTPQEKTGSFASRGEDKPEERYNYCQSVGDSIERSTEVASVTGIINKYFPNSNEANRSGSPSSFADLRGSDEVTSRVIKNLEEQLMPKVGHKCAKAQVGGSRPFTVRTPMRMLSPSLYGCSTGTLKNNGKSCQVGKRLVTASNSIGAYASKQRPSIILCKYKNGSSFCSSIRHLAFELSDRED